MKLSKELNHSGKSVINIQNTDKNLCCKWYLVRYLHPVDKNLVRIRKN